jgi:hypothetical protein
MYSRLKEQQDENAGEQQKNRNVETIASMVYEEQDRIHGG